MKNSILLEFGRDPVARGSSAKALSPPRARHIQALKCLWISAESEWRAAACRAPHRVLFFRYHLGGGGRRGNLHRLSLHYSLVHCCFFVH